MIVRRVLCLAALGAVFSTAAVRAQEATFVQHENVVYGETDGVGLVMDIFTPKGEKNGLGVIDVISGAWHSDRGKIRDHLRAQTFQILCRKGYTVFAIRPGSITKFHAMEMIDHLNRGIRWVKEHAQEYGIDPDRLGMMGASAGGHLASLAAVTAGDGGSGPTVSTSVKAVAVFFPPTDFLDYGGTAIDARSDRRLGQIVRRLAFPQGVDGLSDDQIAERLAEISPARRVTKAAPPFLLIHGDADPVVPLQQSEVLAAVLQKSGVPAELIVKKGGAHPWPTLHEEVEVLAEWFDKQLAGK
jgi:acetyl esterase/lipase